MLLNHGFHFEFRSPLEELDNGQSAAINKGCRIAKGELIGWLNSDDILLPHTVELLVDSYNKHPVAVIFYGDVIF